MSDWHQQHPYDGPPARQGYRGEDDRYGPPMDGGGGGYHDDRYGGPSRRQHGNMSVVETDDFPSAPSYKRAPARRAPPSGEPGHGYGPPRRYPGPPEGGYEPGAPRFSRKSSHDQAGWGAPASRREGPPAEYFPHGPPEHGMRGSWESEHRSQGGRNSREGSLIGSRDGPLTHSPGRMRMDGPPPRMRGDRDGDYPSGRYDERPDRRRAPPPNEPPRGGYYRGSGHGEPQPYDSASRRQSEPWGGGTRYDETLHMDETVHDHHRRRSTSGGGGYSSYGADGEYGHAPRDYPPRDHDEERYAESKQADFEYGAEMAAEHPRGGRARRDSREPDSDSQAPSSNSSHMSDEAEGCDSRGSSPSREAKDERVPTGDDYEVVPPGGPDDQHVQCLVVRDRSGLKRMNPEYNLYVQGNRKRGSEKLLLVARKQMHKNSVSYHIYNVARGHLGGRLKKKGGNYVGKLKCSSNKTENVFYNNEERKEEIGGVLFSKPTLMEHVKEGAQPRKLSVIIPPVGPDRLPVPVKVKYNDPFSGVLSQIQGDALEEGFTILERKEPVFENGNYRLNFHGRVTVPSVKNFQLVCPEDINDVIVQFGKVDDDRFHLDFKGPLNFQQAFCVALAQFNY